MFAIGTGRSASLFARLELLGFGSWYLESADESDTGNFMTGISGNHIFRGGDSK